MDRARKVVVVVWSAWCAGLLVALPVRYLTDWSGTGPTVLTLAAMGIGLVAGVLEARSLDPLSTGERREIRVWVVVLGATIGLIGIAGALDALTS